MISDVSQPRVRVQAGLTLSHTRPLVGHAQHVAAHPPDAVALGRALGHAGLQRGVELAQRELGAAPLGDVRRRPEPFPRPRPARRGAAPPATASSPTCHRRVARGARTGTRPWCGSPRRWRPSPAPGRQGGCTRPASGGWRSWCRRGSPRPRAGASHPSRGSWNRAPRRRPAPARQAAPHRRARPPSPRARRCGRGTS